MNSFRAVERAIEYEAQRQVELLRSGGTIVQETRGWVENRGVTVSQRSKEQAHDYRYFPEPDLPPLLIRSAQVEEIRASLPELPDARRTRYMTSFGLSEQDANVLTEDKALGDYLEQVLAVSKVKDIKTRAKAASNWLLSDLVRLLKVNAVAIQDCLVTPVSLANLLNLLEKERITGKQAKEVLDEAFTSGEMPEAIVTRKGIKPPINDTETLERIVEEVIANNAKAATDYRSGKTNALQSLVGQVMKQTRGQAKADMVQALLRKKLDETQSS